MPFTHPVPDWNAQGAEPPESLKTTGWAINQKPPADYFNWFFYNSAKAIIELQLEAINTDQKGAPNGVATLGSDGKVPASQLNVSAPPDATTSTKGVVQLSNSTTSTSETLAATPKAVKDAKDGLSNQIGILSDDLTTHTANTSNPHSVTKAQVGLGSVENYAVATQAEAQAGAVTNKYMTPQRTKQAIDSQTGDRSTLNTSNKTTLVAAINELFTSVSNGKTQIATAITDKGVAASGGDTFPTLATKIGQISSEVSGEFVVKMQTPVALAKGERVQYTSDIGAKLANPSTLPTSGSNDSAYSPDGVYLAIANQNSPFVTIYKRSGDTFTKLANPSSLPTGSGNGVAFSVDGVYLAVAHATAPFITIYKRSGDTFTKLANPSSLPPSTAESLDFSPDGVHLVVGHILTPNVTIYKRNGDTFTKLADPTVLPVASGKSVAFSSAGEYVVVGYSGGSDFSIYKRSSDTFTKLADPTTLPGGTVNGASFSPDDSYLALAHSSTPYITIYKRSGDTFTKLANPSSLPPNVARGIEFSPYGKLLAVAHASSPYVTFYSQSGDTFTKLANPSSLPSDTGLSMAFNPFETHVTVTQFTSPYLNTYKMGGGLAKNEGVSLTDALLGYTKTSASAGQTVDVAILFK